MSEHIGISGSIGLENALEEQHVLEHNHEVHFENEKRKGLGFFFWLCCTWLAINILGAIFANFLPIQNPLNEPFAGEWNGPSAKHWFGTDEIGRDIFSRVVYGSRVSIQVGFGAVAVGFAIGGTLGMFAAYRRGKFDLILSLLMITALAVPGLIAAIAVLDFWTPAALTKIILVIGVLSVPLFFRVIRAATLSVATRDFVVAAKAQGATTKRIIFRELLPNIMPIALSYLLLGVAAVVVLEGTLAFLGLSVTPPTPSWGNMINESLGSFPQSTWLALFPSLAICLFLMALNFVGDRLRAYFDVAEIKL